MVEANLRSVFGAVIIILTMQSGCNYNQTKGPNDTRPVSLQGNVRIPGYNEVFETVLRTNCSGCHGTAAGVSVESLDAVRANLGRIQDSVQMRRMPVAGMPEDQRQTLLMWLQAGAPENEILPSGPTPTDAPPAPSASPSPTPTPTPPATTLAPNYASLSPVILRSCVPCHNRRGSASFLPLETYEQLTSSQMVNVQDPEASLLLDVITPFTDSPARMPPTTSPLPPISEKEQQTILSWIRNGVPR